MTDRIRVESGAGDDAVLAGVNAFSPSDQQPLELIDAVDLDKLEIPPPSFVVEHLFPIGALVLLSGDTGSCKTAFLVHAMVAFAFGLPVGSRFDVVRGAGPVLYFNGELDPALMQSTMRAAARGLRVRLDDLPKGRIHFVGDQGMADLRFKSERPDDDARASFEMTLQERRPSIVAFDTCRALFDFDEKETAHVRAEFGWLKSLATKHRCCIVVVHHLRKIGGTSNSERERVSGSRDLVAAVDVHLAVKATNGQPMRALYIDKTRHPLAEVRAGVEFPVEAIFDPPAATGECGQSTFVVGAPGLADSMLTSESALQRDLLARLDAEGPLTRNQLGAGDRGSGNMKRAFNELVKRGRIIKTGRKSARSDLWTIAGSNDDSEPRDDFEPPTETRPRTGPAGRPR